jgi:hypothetical protein
VLLRTTVLRCPKLLGLRADHRAHQAARTRDGPDETGERRLDGESQSARSARDARDQQKQPTRRAARTQQNWY